LPNGFGTSRRVQVRFAVMRSRVAAPDSEGNCPNSPSFSAEMQADSGYYTVGGGISRG
jgi:hypothetical protein